jgi:MFS transporter, DHA1 family, inner membrane transport protein
LLTESPPKHVGRGVAIGMYCLVLASYALNAADRQLFPLLLHDVRQTYGFSLTKAGLLSTIFTLGLALAGLPTGYLLARISRKSTLILGIAIFSSATALTVFAVGFADMLLYLAASGIGEAIQFTAIVAIATSYFARNRAAAIGSVNLCFGIGAFCGPILASLWLGAYQSWRAPMLFFGLIGFVMIAAILFCVRLWFTETAAVGEVQAASGGAATLLNFNSIILTVLSVLAGLVLYGFTGLYSTFLRESLHYTAKQAGLVTGCYGVGALVSIAGGWLGDRFSPRLVLSGAFFAIAILAYSCFHATGSLLRQALLTGAFGAAGSGTLFVNLAGYHVKAVHRSLAGRASGTFVTGFYSAAAMAGYLMGGIATRTQWATAEIIQVSLLASVAGCIALTLRPSEMCL